MLPVMRVFVLLRNEISDGCYKGKVERKRAMVRFFL
jgi:hypothetical protein